MITPYASSNGNFSNKAHEAAKEKIYPLLFGVEKNKLTFESTLLETSERNKILDGEMAIDRMVKVQVEGLHEPLTFTIQERFRRKKYANWKDLTITEWNYNSNLPSELYKITAGLFVYGYYDDEANTFIDAIAISVPKLLLAITNDNVNFSREENPRTNQSFFGFTFSNLKKAGLIDFQYSCTEG